MAKIVCTECGTPAYQDAYVDATTGEVVSTFDNFFCPTCEGECSVGEEADTSALELPLVVTQYGQNDFEAVIQSEDPNDVPEARGSGRSRRVAILDLLTQIDI